MDRALQAGRRGRRRRPASNQIRREGLRSLALQHRRKLTAIQSDRTRARAVRSGNSGGAIRRPRGTWRYFLLPKPAASPPTPFWLGAAAIVLIFSFFGFFFSRLPFCSP